MSIPNSQHQQYPVIVALSQKLSKLLVGAILVDAYTLSKEELVLVFQLRSKSCFTVKIVQQFQSCFLFFEDDRPEKISNAQLCFESILNKPITRVEQHPGNRSFSLHIAENYQLVFKMYEGLVNVLLFTDEKVTDMFRESIVKDWELSLNSFTTKGTAEEIGANHFFVYKREHMHPFYLTVSKQPDTLVFETSDVLEVLNEFSKICLNHYRFATGKQQLLSKYAAERNRLKGLVDKTQKGLSDKQTETTAEEIANIIMANMHAIAPKSTQVELFDFYHNKNIMVKLKQEMNAQQNAAYYYRKHKNGNIELVQLQQKLKTSEERLIVLDQLLSDIEKAQLYRELKPYLPKEKEKKQIALPFRQFEYEGFLIWVGKSAANNDELTIRHSHKNDLWLHAKDVTGSHVLVKWKAGKEFPKKVIERAAQLAAYYSKLKGSGLVPVSYTLKKFVRKPKGAEPGQVMIDKEEVLMVEPKLAE
ncbi:MAG: NFACT RNA binding domain-containing protein [Bacteroidota bacterium]